MNRDRFLVKSFGDNIEGTKVGLAKTLELLNNYNHAVIVVPTIGKVDGTMLVTALGEELSKNLIKNREVNLANNKKISLCGQQTLKNYKHADVYLALWGTEYIIAEIEALHKWKAAILVTWQPGDSAAWEAANKVSVIYDDKKG